MHDNEYCYEDDSDFHDFEAHEQTKERSEKITYPTFLDYLFHPEDNEEYATAAHIKIEPAPNPAFAGEILVVALDDQKRIEHMCSFDPASALKPITVEYIYD
jgi:hypothetical protein